MKCSSSAKQMLKCDMQEGSFTIKFHHEYTIHATLLGSEEISLS